MSSTIMAGTRLMGEIWFTPPEGPLNTITPHIANQEVLLQLAVVQEFWDGLGALVARAISGVRKPIGDSNRLTLLKNEK
ncbi:hypothetical protein PGTUg99_005263 [Puccinia graminis f. sp. tritici]|uniref:Uncharacterized protein n=1 Tax=Puccinia graminis f. sp. tritici TaxID=56615 RepID=A0A5B0MP18_PUCGR|nr:hypothetical protein PGTUg99_005263 [Puccinia graminis f. sp. tritici]